MTNRADMTQGEHEHTEVEMISVRLLQMTLLVIAVASFSNSMDSDETAPRGGRRSLIWVQTVYYRDVLN